MLEFEGTAIASLAGLAAGCVLGLAARVGRFCTMGAVEDAVYGDDLGRLRMVALAAATAIIGTALLASLGVFDPSETLYARLGWSPLGAVLGGLVFGYGMAHVGTCGFGALARIGGGDLRSVVMVMVIGLTAYATLNGPLAGLRLWLAEIAPQPGTGLDRLAGDALGLPPILAALGAGAGLAAFALLWGGTALARRRVLWGALAGLVVPFAWAATSYAGAVGFDVVPLESVTFSQPLGESLLYVMLNPLGALPGFAVASVAGVVLGAAAGSLFMGEFRWEACDDARELRRQFLGAALMGLGGVLALGCTIGQGLSALSVLSPGAPIVVLSIIAGARLGLFVLVEGLATSR
ncbi:MAG: YeeE/YedE family protein [Pseudomonadota bacterium]